MDYDDLEVLRRAELLINRQIRKAEAARTVGAAQVAKGSASLEVRAGAEAVLARRPVEPAEDLRYRQYLEGLAKSSSLPGGRERALEQLERLDETAETRAAREKLDDMKARGIPTWIVR